MKLKLAVVFVLGLAAANAMACYTVYDRSNRMVYNSDTPPVDMSLPLHQTLPRVFPGGHMVFGTDCPRDLTLARKSVSAPTPLLTDHRTARALNLPHTVLASGIAVVPQRPDSMRPGVVVVASTPALVEPATAIMGGPPTPANAKASYNTVITEMYNPPLTVVQQADGRVLAPAR